MTTIKNKILVLCAVLAIGLPLTSQAENDQKSDV